MKQMIVEFHGVRGSLASPGPTTVQVGGNTSCVLVRAGDTTLILDAGTGLRGLGQALLRAGTREVTLLLSHLHWDHIQGLPFFAPLYVPGCRVEILSGPSGELGLAQALARQMCPPFFPVRYDEVAAQLAVRDLRADERLAVGEIEVTVRRLHHPDPVYAYRLDWAGRSLVFATDTEHYGCVDPHLRDLARGADVLIYDAQYTPEEYSGQAGPPRVGWGHSTWAAGVELARSAGVAELVLFHHDPGRSDAEVAAIEALARQQFAAASAAREGQRLLLAARVHKGDRAA